MKTFYSLTLMLIISTSVIAQNQSNGLVNPSIFNPTGQQFTSGLPFAPEIFRFRPGLVTQADDFADPDNPFNFFEDRWFSIGRLQTSEFQTVYGLRFQLPLRAATFGYQDISDTNPRVQWIGIEDGIGDLEFRFANSFTSTNSDLVATMRSDSGTVFAQNDLSDFDDAKVGIRAEELFDKSLEIIHVPTTDNNAIRYGVDVIHDSNSLENYGYNAVISGNADDNFGVNTLVEGSAERNYGFNTLVSGSAGRNFGLHAVVNGEATFNAGVIGNVSNAQVNYGVYGIVPTTGGLDVAGFFDGDVETTGMYNPSDSRLKESVSNIDKSLENILSLKPKMYEYIKSDKINLSQGQQYGFIAQELEEIFPELIKNVKKPVFDKGGNITEYFEYKSVNYIPLIAILTASIQELSREVEDLKATNNSYLVYSDRLSSDERINKIHETACRSQSRPVMAVKFKSI